MKLLSFPKILIISLFFIFLFSCGKTDEITLVCCSTETITTADFQFLGRIPGTDSIYWIEYGPFDTVYNANSTASSRVYFKAKSSNMDSYQWKVGTDPSTFTDSLFYLNFGGVDGAIDVTLTTTNDDVNKECFPNDEGTETLMKSLEMKTFSTFLEHPIYGKYEGYNEDTPNTVFEIEIGLYPGSNLQVVYNFPYQCNEFQNIEILTTGGRGFIYDEKLYTKCGDPHGHGWLEQGNQTLIIEYSVEDINDPSNRVSKRFVGQRI